MFSKGLIIASALAAAVVNASPITLSRRTPPGFTPGGPVYDNGVCGYVDAPVRIFSGKPSLGLLSYGQIKSCLCVDTLEAWIASQTNLDAAVRHLGHGTVKSYVEALVVSSATSSKACWVPSGLTCVPCPSTPVTTSNSISAKLDAGLSLAQSKISGSSSVDGSLFIKADVRSTLDKTKATVNAAVDATVSVSVSTKAKIDTAIEACVDEVDVLKAKIDATAVATIDKTKAELDLIVLAATDACDAAKANVDLAVKAAAELAIKTKATLEATAKATIDATGDAVVKAKADFDASVSASFDTCSSVKGDVDAAVHAAIQASLAAIADAKIKATASAKATLDLVTGVTADVKSKVKIDAEVDAKVAANAWTGH